MSDSSESSSLSGGLARRRLARLTRHRPWLANSIATGHDPLDSPSGSSSDAPGEEQEVPGCGVVAAVIAAARRFTSLLPVKAGRRSSPLVYRSRLTEKQVRLGSLAAGTASVLCVSELATSAAQDPESGVNSLVGCSGGSSPSVDPLPSAGWRFWSLKRKLEKPKRATAGKGNRGALVGARSGCMATRVCRLPVRRGSVSACLKRPFRRFLPRKGKKVGFALVCFLPFPFSRTLADITLAKPGGICRLGRQNFTSL